MSLVGLENNTRVLTDYAHFRGICGIYLNFGKEIN
jgi:hypothetical protein